MKRLTIARWAAFFFAIIIGAGCSAVPSTEQIQQLDALHAEIQVLLKEKQSLEIQRSTLALSISTKEAKLKEIEDRKNTLIQIH